MYLFLIQGCIALFSNPLIFLFGCAAPVHSPCHAAFITFLKVLSEIYIVYRYYGLCFQFGFQHGNQLTHSYTWFGNFFYLRAAVKFIACRGIGYCKLLTVLVLYGNIDPVEALVMLIDYCRNILTGEKTKQPDLRHLNNCVSFSF